VTLAPAQDVLGRDLTLALGNDPMLDAEALTRMRIGPSRDVAGGIDAMNAGLEILVDGDAAFERKSRLFRYAERGPHADAHHHEVGGERRAVAQREGLAVDMGHRRTQMEDDAVRLVKLANEAADRVAQYAAERDAFRAHHVDGDTA